ncbi:MAG: flagellar basal-body rod protein FlgG [Planctomycetota bacterium]
MIRAMRTAASGMQAQQMQVDTLANNIANVNTTAFKANRVNFRSLLYSTIREPGAATGAKQMNPTGLQIGSGVEVSSSIKQFAQGEMELTGNDYDLLIQGEGFFRIDMGNGEFRYTRDGSFRKDVDGAIVTVDGHKLDPAIQIPADAINITIAQDGTVQGTIPGSDTPSELGKIGIVTFANPAGLRAEGANLYRVTASSGVAKDQTPGNKGAGFLRQGFLERSNVSVVNELISLIQAQRNYEVNSRTIRVSDEMLQQVSNLI